AVHARARARRVVARAERLRDLEELEDVQTARGELGEQPQHVVCARVNRVVQRRAAAVARFQDALDLLQPRALGGVGDLVEQQVEEWEGRLPRCVGARGGQ